jgi:thioredoxin 1
MPEFLVYIVIAVVGFFVFVQLYFLISSLLKKGKTIKKFSGELGRKVENGNKLLLYFYTPTCGACKAMTPVIDKLSRENKDVHKINLARDMNLAKIFGVMGTPATIVVEDAKIKKYILGARSESFLKKLVVE